MGLNPQQYDALLLNYSYERNKLSALHYSTGDNCQNNGFSDNASFENIEYLRCKRKPGEG